MTTPEHAPQSIVGDDAVRSRGVGVRDAAASAAELDELARMRAWTTAPKSEARVFWTGVMFLTQLPCDGVMGCDHSPGFLMLAFAWFPSIGAVIGWIGAAVFDYVLFSSLHAGCAACAAILATLSVTCAFHDDGLADSADALLGGWTRDEIFKIMKDSRVGTFGCVALIMQNITRVMLLTRLSQSHWAICGSSGAGPALVVANSLCRATAAPLVYSCAYVVDKDDAKGSFYAWFGRSRDLLSWRRVAFSSLSAVAISLLLLGAGGTMHAVLICLLCTAASKWYGERVLNGVAGDYLGATICITEIAVYFGLVSMYAKASMQNFGPLLRMLATMLAILLLGLYTKGKFRRRCRR